METHILFIPENEADILYCGELNDDGLIDWASLFRHL